MVAVFPIMNGKIEEDIKDESILSNFLLHNHSKQVVIYESGQPVLKVECGTTLEVMKLLYESEHEKNGDILGVRPRNQAEIPCIITLHESKLEENAYDVIIKDKKPASPPNGYGVHDRNSNEHYITTRCIDCSRESWKSKRYTTVGMNTEISLNPLMEVDSIRQLPLANNNYSQQASTEPSYPPRSRGRPPIQRPVPVVTHGNAYNTVHKKEYMVAALPTMPITNGNTNSEIDYMEHGHYRSRSPRNSPSHHNSGHTGHTKICYPPPSKPLTLEISPYDQSHPIRHRMHQPRSHSPQYYRNRSPVYSTSAVWKKEPVDIFPPPHYSSGYHKSQHAEILRSPRRYPQYDHEVPAMTTVPSQAPQQPAEGEPPVYVLPNDFDLQRDRVDPHIIAYHSPKDSHSGERINIKNENLQSHSTNSERESPASDSGKSATEESNSPEIQTNIQHNIEQKLSCKICKQYFPTKSTLYKHLRGHSSDEKPFKCNECGQGFTLSSNLRQHRIIHRGYKPFQCEYCGKKFMRSNVYKQHRRIHTGEQMHKCDLCPSEFLQRYALIKHKKKAHNVETFEK